jgi:hypothetical protein
MVSAEDQLRGRHAWGMENRILENDTTFDSW